MLCYIMTMRKKKALFKHEKDLLLKKIIGKTNEELDATGQESEAKAAKWVKEKGIEERHIEDEKRAEEEWKAHDSKGKVLTYKDAIYNAVKRQMVESYALLPRGFIWYPVKSEKGIEIWVRDLDKQWYARGMTICNNPTYDLNCVDRLIDKALNHMDNLEQEYEERAKLIKEKIEGKDKKTDSGIILP